MIFPTLKNVLTVFIIVFAFSVIYVNAQSRGKINLIVSEKFICYYFILFVPLKLDCLAIIREGAHTPRVSSCMSTSVVNKFL